MVLNNAALVTLTCVFIVVSAVAHEPVPGPDFEGCISQNSSDTLYAKLPFFNMMIQGGPVTYAADIVYDFCAYMDTLYCALEPLAGLADEISEFSGLVQCLNADLNGPMTGTGEIPLTGNGIPDGQCELGVVAAVLNTPGHPLYEETMNKFRYNFYQAKELLIAALSDVPPFGSFPGGDLRNLVRIVAPNLPRALAAILAGYAVLGDNKTLDMLDEMLSMLSMLGLTPPEGGIRSLSQSVPALAHNGDANSDGFTNRQAFDYYVSYSGCAYSDYPAIAVDPDQPIQLLTLEGGGVFTVGTRVELTAVLNEEVVAPESPDAFTWYNGLDPLTESTEGYLVLEDTDESDSGNYKIVVPVEWLLDPEDNTPIILSASTAVQINPPVPAISGKWWLTLLLSVVALSGMVVIRYRKQERLIPKQENQ